MSLKHSRALASGDFSDLTVIYGGQTLKVHRLVICSQSPGLAKVCAESDVRPSPFSVGLL
jgi:hypothetical protein